MSFADAISTSLARYADFAGRSRRAEYWYFNLFVILAYIAIGMLSGVAPKFAALVAILAVFGLLIPSIAVNVRRLHDVDRSGWWIWIGIVPLLGAVLLLIWHCTPGTSGSNRFGSDPKTA